MPTDPKTGKKLPYAGEPGAPEDAPPMPEGEGAAQEVIPDRDLVPLANEADSLMLGDMLNNVEGALGPQETSPADMTEEDMAGDDATMDTKPLEDMLGVSSERASQILAAAQMMPQMEGKSPTEIAEMLAGDMQLRMQVEKIAARTADTATEDAALEADMAPAEEPPAEEPMPEEAEGGPSMAKALTGAAGFGSASPIGAKLTDAVGGVSGMFGATKAAMKSAVKKSK